MRRLFIWCPHHFLFSGEGGPFSTSARNGRGVGQGRGTIFCYKKRGWKERRRSDRGERFRRRRRHFGKVKEVANEGSLPPPRHRRFRKVNNFACRATKRKREGERAETRRRRRRLGEWRRNIWSLPLPTSGKQQGGWKMEGVRGRRFSSSSWPILAAAGK